MEEISLILFVLFIFAFGWRSTTMFITYMYIQHIWSMPYCIVITIISILLDNTMKHLLIIIRNMIGGEDNEENNSF